MAIGVVLAAPSHAVDNTASDERVTLRVEVPSPLAKAPWDRATRAVFDEFVREHPEINVAPAPGVPLDAAGGTTGGSKGLMGIAGGGSPDVFSLFFARVHSYIDQRFVAPIDDYIVDPTYEWDDSNIEVGRAIREKDRQRMKGN